MSDLPIVACVVEGDGEEMAVPLLVRRIIEDVQLASRVTTRLARRVNRNRLVQSGGIEVTVEAVAREIGRSGAILILIDADDDCPATLGPRLQQRARAAREDLPISVVLANKEYEAWFLAAARSLRGERSLPADLEPPDHPERIRDAKGWLGKRMAAGRKYSERLDQPALSARFDLRQARSADSFDKFYREVVALALGLAADA